MNPPLLQCGRVVCGLFAFSALTAHGITYSWNQDTAISDDWSLGVNWSPSGPPPGGANGIAINSLSSALVPVRYDAGVGVTTLSGATTLGGGASESGFLSITSGVLDFSGGTTLIGNSGTGVIVVKSGATLVKEAGQMSLGSGSGGLGTVTVEAGGVFSLTNQNSNLVVGGSGTGVLNLDGGHMILANASARQVNVGTGTGTGILSVRGGTLSAAGSTATQTLNIGYSGGAGTGRGTLRGYGTVNLVNSATTGSVQVGGAVIADGTQPNAMVADHTLDLSYTSLATAGNVSGTTHLGWFASSRGAVILKPIATSVGAGNIFWGDDQSNAGKFTIGNASATVTDVLINSLYLHKAPANTATSVTVALLHPSRQFTARETGTLLANGTGDPFLGVWQIGASGGTLALDKVYLRYDEQSGTPAAIYFWDGVGSGWQNLGGVSVDAANFLVNYNGSLTIPNGSSAFFAWSGSAPPPPPAISPFGVSTSANSLGQFSGTNEWATLIAQAGVQWMRGFRAFNGIEPQQGTFNWTLVDRDRAKAQEVGLNMMGFLGLNASWINSDLETFPVANIPAWSEYVTAVVNHCKSDAGGLCAVKHWEVWNEPPNFSSNGTTADYATTVVAAYDAAKAADPECQVGLAAKSTHIAWLQQTIQAGAADHFDFITLHPYEIFGTITDGCEALYMSIVPTVRKMLAAKNPTRVNAPIWFTEIGEPVGGANGGVSITVDIQAHDLVKAYTMGIAQGVTCLNWYEAKDPTSNQSHGLLTSTKAQRPAYIAMKQLTQYLGGQPGYLGWVLINGQDYGFVFQGATTTVMATWAPPGVTDVVNFGQSVQIVNPMTGAVSNASSYSLTNAPILVVDVPPSLVTLAQANKNLPFPWGGDYTNAPSVSVVMGAPDTETGLHHLFEDFQSTAVTAYGGPARYCDKAINQTFVVDPNFLSYTATPIQITAVVRRNANNDAATIGLQYECATGTGARSAGTYAIPGNGQWYSKTWTINDPMFVGKYGWNFLLSCSTKNYFIQSVTVTKL